MAQFIFSYNLDSHLLLMTFCVGSCVVLSGRALQVFIVLIKPALVVS